MNTPEKELVISAGEQDLLTLSGKQMREILNLCGYSMSEFAKFLGKSTSYVTRDLSASALLQTTYVEALQRFVAIDNYVESLRQLAGQPARKTLSGRELKQLIQRSGIDSDLLARFLDGSRAWLSDMYRSRLVPLRYIDAVIAFVGQDQYDYIIADIRTAKSHTDR